MFPSHKEKVSMKRGFPVVLALSLAVVYTTRADDAKPEVGKTAPAIELPASGIASVLPDKKDAKTLTLADFKDKKNVVLWFFPKAMTGG
jgi:hypothetical protein